MKKGERKIRTDKCGNFCFVNNVGGSFVFCKEPLSIEKEQFRYVSQLPTVFTFQEWEELLLESNQWWLPTRALFNDLVITFYNKYKEDWRDLRWNDYEDWYDLRWKDVWKVFRKVFWIKEWLYNPYIGIWYRDGWNFFYSCSNLRGSNEKKTALWIDEWRVCTFMNCIPETELWIRPVSLLSNRQFELWGSDFIYVDLNNEHWH